MKLDRLSGMLKDKLKVNPSKSLTIFSDSPDKARALLEPNVSGAKVITKDLPTWETIGELCQSQIFVGTFSKVSLWVVIFRYFSKDLLPSYMPLEALENLEQLLGRPMDSNKILFYA
jgi:hypothetical protein